MMPTDPKEPAARGESAEPIWPIDQATRQQSDDYADDLVGLVMGMMECQPGRLGRHSLSAKIAEKIRVTQRARDLAQQAKGREEERLRLRMQVVSFLTHDP